MEPITALCWIQGAHTWLLTYNSIMSYLYFLQTMALPSNRYKHKKVRRSMNDITRIYTWIIYNLCKIAQICQHCIK